MGRDFRVPNKCCVCLGPAETTLQISRSQTSAPPPTTYSFEIPICLACQTGEKRKQIIIAISVILSAGLFGALIGLGVRDWGWGGGLFLGVFVGSLIYGWLHNYVLQPVQIKKDGQGIWYRNRQLQEDTRQMNGLPPKKSAFP